MIGFTEHSHEPKRTIKCDRFFCKNDSTRWFQSTSVRICDDPECRDHFLEMWNKPEDDHD